MTDLNFSVTVNLSNGTQVTASKSHIVLEEPGPRGGVGPRVVIPASEWPLINSAVEELTAALARVIDGSRPKQIPERSS